MTTASAGIVTVTSKGKQLLYSDFHPEVVGFGEPNLFIGPAGKGSITFPVTTPLFSALLVGVIVIVGALTFFPALSLGPIVEHLLMAKRQLF